MSRLWRLISIDGVVESDKGTPGWCLESEGYLLGAHRHVTLMVGFTRKLPSQHSFHQRV